jgi:DinB superfamily
MLDYMRSILTTQFEAALCMLDHCIRECPPEHWEGKIANRTFRWVAYHTLFWVDVYLSPGDEEDLVLRDLHSRGGDERNDELLSPGLEKEECLAYVTLCRQELLKTLGAETAASLQAPCGFHYRKISRGELYLYSLRHVQHHVGQLSAYLRRVYLRLAEADRLPWVGSGWR